MHSANPIISISSLSESVLTPIKTPDKRTMTIAIIVFALLTTCFMTYLYLTRRKLVKTSTPPQVLCIVNKSDQKASFDDWQVVRDFFQKEKIYTKDKTLSNEPLLGATLGILERGKIETTPNKSYNQFSDIVRDFKFVLFLSRSHPQTCVLDDFGHAGRFFDMRQSFLCNLPETQQTFLKQKTCSLLVWDTHSLPWTRLWIYISASLNPLKYCKEMTDCGDGKNLVNLKFVMKSGGSSLHPILKTIFADRP